MEKAFGAYLGDDKAAWEAYDASKLLASGATKGAFDDILVDVGGADSFLVGEVNQLQPEALKAACAAAGVSLELRMQEGYDHSYYFISTFIADHIAYHAKALKA